MAKNSKPRTRKDAIKHGRKNSEAFNALLDNYLAKRKLNKVARHRLEAMRGSRPAKGPIAASDVEARDELRKQFIFHIDSWQRQHKSLRFLFITLMSDEFRSSKKKPAIWVKTLKRKADKTLRDLGLEGVCMIEACPLLNPPDMQRPEIHFHVHALCWVPADTDVPALRLRLASVRSWSNAWGIPPTHIREITPDKGVAAWWAGYMIKHSIDALNVIETSGVGKLRRTQKGYRGDFALRVFEGLSQIALRDLFFSVGDGKEVRDSVWRNVTRARQRAHGHLRTVREFNRSRFWRKFWARTRANHGTPWQVFGSTL